MVIMFHLFLNPFRKFTQLFIKVFALFILVLCTHIGFSFANDSLLIISAQQRGNTVNSELGINKTMLIELPENAADVIVANPALADAVMRTPRRAYVVGQDIGETNVMFLNKKGALIASVALNVYKGGSSIDTAGLKSLLNRSLPGQSIRVEAIGETIILQGTVQSVEQSKIAENITQRFMDAAIAERIATGQTSEAAIRYQTILSDDKKSSKNVTNLLRVSGQDQVLMKVTIAEVRREILNSLGINLSEISGSIGEITYNASGISSSPLGFSKKLGGAVSGDGLRGTVSALEQKGLMRVLAEPTLVAVSGEEAEFRAMGKVQRITGRSITYDTGGSATLATETLDTKETDVGIRLKFIPVVVGDNRLSLQVHTYSSELSSQDGIKLPSNNSDIEDIIMQTVQEREAKTVVELPSGGSLSIAGVVQHREEQVIDQVPGLSSIPILGSLFRSRQFKQQQSELVILVSAYIVKPNHESEYSLPTDGVVSSDTFTGNFLGKLTQVYGKGAVAQANKNEAGVPRVQSHAMPQNHMYTGSVGYPAQPQLPMNPNYGMAQQGYYPQQVYPQTPTYPSQQGYYPPSTGNSSPSIRYSNPRSNMWGGY